MNHNSPSYTIQEHGCRDCGACEMSVAQQAFVDREIRRHRQVTICRLMLLVLLLALWELAADMHWIYLQFPHHDRQMPVQHDKGRKSFSSHRGDFA